MRILWYRIIEYHTKGVLSKNTMEKWIIPHLSVGSRGFEPKVFFVELVEAISIVLKQVVNGGNCQQKSSLA